MLYLTVLRLPLSLLLSIFFLGYVEALPHLQVLKRQAPNASTNDTQTVLTQQITNTTAGMVMESCAISFTPVTDANGNAQVMEVQACSMSLLPSGASVPVPAASGVPAVVSASPNFPVVTLSTSSSDAVPTPSPTLSPNSSSASSAVVVSSSSAASASSSVSGSSASVASVTPSSASGSSAAALASSSASSNEAAVSPVGAAASATPFAIPGKTLQVLPIGLGIFGGISAIALIVVAIVTYERTKYRKAFRRRKMAEAGSPMGYGGMDTNVTA